MGGLVLLLGLALGNTASDAQIPGTEIYRIPVQRQGDEVSLGEPTNLTQRKGYDNQPAFVPNGTAFLYTSIREDGQADIYRFDLESGETTRVTDTEEAEYSPTPLPGGGFSTVRVELDTLSTQRLWEFDAGGKNPRLVFEDVTAVGYHCWANETELVMFLVGEPHTLHRAQRGEPGSVLVAENIDRSLQRVPGESTLTFTQHREGELWILYVDAGSGETEDLFAVPEGAVDMVWTPWKTIWMTSGSELWERGAEDEEWTQVHDFAPGLQGLTRMAFSPDGTALLLVAAEPTEEETPQE